MSDETAGVQSESNPRTALAALFLLTYVGLAVGLWAWGLTWRGSTADCRPGRPCPFG